jgi:phage terminase small subunit
MPLKNARWERFAQGLAKGLTGDEAYEKAGYKRSRKNASRLRTNEDIKTRVAVILSKASEIAEITIADVIKELALIGFANMQDYLTTTDDGDAYVDLSVLTRDQAAAIGEVTVDRYFESSQEDARQVIKTRFKLLDKRAALVDIGKHLGAFPAGGVNIQSVGLTKIVIQRFGDDLDDLIDAPITE